MSIFLSTVPPGLSIRPCKISISEQSEEQKNMFYMLLLKFLSHIIHRTIMWIADIKFHFAEKGANPQ